MQRVVKGSFFLWIVESKYSLPKTKIILFPVIYFILGKVMSLKTDWLNANFWKKYDLKNRNF